MEKSKVVFDIDDILWSLNRKMSEVTGIDYDKIITYSISENELFSESEKKEIMKAYGSTELFKDIKWFNGIERINDLSDVADVYINSNAFSEDIVRMKREQLRTVVSIPEQNINISVVGKSTEDYKKKLIDSDTFIFIDDSPYNVAMSPAKVNIMIRTPWNQSEYGRKQLSGKNVIFCDDLNEAIDTVYELIA